MSINGGRVFPGDPNIRFRTFAGSEPTTRRSFGVLTPDRESRYATSENFARGGGVGPRRSGVLRKHGEIGSGRGTAETYYLLDPGSKGGSNTMDDRWGFGTTLLTIDPAFGSARALIVRCIFRAELHRFGLPGVFMIRSALA
ncbi:hypothetical protein R1flu_001781 [Riccia fluitans]|uniref:Uncharacterized protein n=1 Tax=Riccia fluitans TaxID=41844 RepID=A0ABD1Y495_9MARC